MSIPFAFVVSCFTTTIVESRVHDRWFHLDAIIEEYMNSKYQLQEEAAIKKSTLSRLLTKFYIDTSTKKGNKVLNAGARELMFYRHELKKDHVRQQFIYVTSNLCTTPSFPSATHSLFWHVEATSSLLPPVTRQYAASISVTDPQPAKRRKTRQSQCPDTWLVVGGGQWHDIWFGRTKSHAMTQCLWGIFVVGQDNGCWVVQQCPEPIVAWTISRTRTFESKPHCSTTQCHAIAQWCLSGMFVVAWDDECWVVKQCPEPIVTWTVSRTQTFESKPHCSTTRCHAITQRCLSGIFVVAWDDGCPVIEQCSEWLGAWTVSRTQQYKWIRTISGDCSTHSILLWIAWSTQVIPATARWTKCQCCSWESNPTPHWCQQISWRLSTNHQKSERTEWRWHNSTPKVDPPAKGTIFRSVAVSCKNKHEQVDMG